MCPVKALLATAFEDGLIRGNPSANVRVILPDETVDLDDDTVDAQEARALTEAELERFLAALPERHQLFPRFLASTGLRIGEAIELRWKDVDLDAGKIYVRRAFYRSVVGPPKSRFGIRSIPLTRGLRDALAKQHNTIYRGEDDFVFGSRTGTRLDPHNYRSRVIRPAAVAAGSNGRHSIPCDIPSRRSVSETGAMPSRCNFCSGITLLRSRWTRTSTHPTTTFQT